MDFSFTDEQQELQKQARAYLTERYAPERVAELVLEVGERKIH